MTLKETEKQGRFIVANRDICAGELVAMDQPEIRFLDGQFAKTHCWHCLKRAQDTCTPCHGCSGVIFCSNQCLNNAANSHKYECGITDVLYNSDIGVWILALKVVASKNASFFASAPGKVKLEDDHLEKINQLVSHFNSDLYSAPELMKEALVCVFLTRCLISGGYFGTETNSEFDRPHVNVALWLHRFMRISKFNSHEVTEVSEEGPSLSSPKARRRRIGTCINPNLALINHSCDPNYGRVWCHSGVLAFATRPIKKGQEICDSYSGVFSQSILEERSLVHSRYHFRCQCVACKEDWPLMANLEQRIKGLPVQAYKDRSGLKRLLEAYKKSKDKQVKADDDEGLEVCVKVVEMAYSVLRPPHAVLYQLEDQIHDYLWLIYG